MTRPDLPPPLRPGALRRERLLDRLEGRWSVPLTVVVGGGGAGKTTLLVQSLEDETDRRDVWVTAVPGDDAASMWGRALAAMGHDVDCGATVDDVVEAMVAQAPTGVCLVVDDVHRLADESPLDELLERLPRNGHLMVGSRRRPALRLSRRSAAGQLIEVGQAELLLDDDELREWSRRRHVDLDVLAGAEGWPALVELATRGDGAGAGRAYLEEEAVAALGSERLQAVARFASVGGGDDAVARAVTGIGLEELVGDLPLILGDPQTTARPHDLWDELLEPHLSAADRRDAAVAAAEVLRSVGDLAPAIELVAGVGATDDLHALLREACLTILDGGLSPDRLERWSMLLDGGDDAPGIAHLVRGLSAREHDVASARCWDELAAAAAAFRDERDDEAEVAALAQLGYLAQITGRDDELASLFGRMQELAAACSRTAAPFLALGTAWFHFATGDPEAQQAAVDGLADDDLPEAWRLVRDYLWANALLQQGRPEEGLERIPAALRQRTIPLPGALTIEDQLEWMAGRPEVVLARGPLGAGAEFGARDRFMAGALGATFNAYAGRLDEATRAQSVARRAVGDDPPPQVALQLQALSAVPDIVLGHEDAAAATLRSVFAVAPLDLPAVRGTFAPHLALVYLLVDESRPYWDEADLGPAHSVARSLARVLVAHRERGDLAPVRLLAWPAPGQAAAFLPVPWLVELAVIGAAAGVPAARSIAGWALEHWGTPAREALRRHAEGDDESAQAATRLLSELPVPPDEPVEIAVLGPMTLHHGSHVSSSEHWRRERVRSLLLYLVLRGPTARERLCEELWPDLDPRKADKNLRTTLSYLHQALEPTREPGDAPWYVRDEHGLLTLHRSTDVDLWTFDRHLDRAAECEREGAPLRSLEHYLSALALWRGELSASDADHAWADLERTRVHSRLTRAAVRAADLLVATRRPEDAIEACHLAISVDRWHEPAYRTLIRAYLDLDDTTAARATVRSAQAALAEIEASFTAPSLEP